ncbi:hypothetical protein [Streptomyces lunalinharesii]|uniref:hypothetical protein n=1 Tax=Streptomyces lunalinharesii TaxID=333384 RepID=UPI0031E24619
MIIEHCTDAEISCRFLQVQPGTDDRSRQFEESADCGNSMIAAAVACVAARPPVRLTIVNSATGLRIDTHFGDTSTRHVPVEADVTPRFHGQRPESFTLPGSDACWKVDGTPTTLLKAANPYVIVRAADLDVAVETLRKPDPGALLLDRLRRIRRHAARHLGLPGSSELPKIAVAEWTAAGVLTARTVYLGRWHPHLPLSAGISVAMAALVPRSTVFRSPRDEVSVSARASDIQVHLAQHDSLITRCSINGLAGELLAEVTVPAEQQ